VNWRILQGDVLDRLADLEDGSVQTCVTSPPYFGLRDYGHDGQIGLEAAPDEYVSRLVDVFHEVRRVLRDDGTIWLNIGDSYNADGRKGRAHMGEGKNSGYSAWVNKTMEGTKPKDLLGIPWLTAFALRAVGWYLRSDIIWAKPNPMPESVTDRPTKAHEYLFLLSKSARYFYDADAVREDASEVGIARGGRARITPAHSPPGTQPNRRSTSNGDADWLSAGRNKRTVWTVATQPFPGAHFAVFPPKLIEPCVLAGSAPGDTVLDPFCGSGTTGLVALRHGRSFVGIELNPEYVELARRRIVDDAPLLNSVAEAA
jgi:DNA modification methylase